jgi:hypothetical protein
MPNLESGLIWVMGQEKAMTEDLKQPGALKKRWQNELN